MDSEITLIVFHTFLSHGGCVVLLLVKSQQENRQNTALKCSLVPAEKNDWRSWEVKEEE